jgi:hypothetical protein
MRLSIVLSLAILLASTTGCSWCDSFFRRIGGTNTATAEQLAEKKRQDVSAAAEPD